MQTSPSPRPALGRGWLFGLAALALGVRLAALAYLGDFGSPFLTEPEVIARVIVAHGFYGIDENSVYGSNTLTVTAFIPPAYPALLALALRLFGAQADLAVRLAQIGLSAASVALVAELGWRVLRRVDAAVLAGLMAAGYPPLVAGAHEISPVTLEVLLVLLFVRLTLPGPLVPGAPRWSQDRADPQGAFGSGPLWAKSPDRLPPLSAGVRIFGRWAAAGAVLGLAALVRAPLLLLLPWTAIALWANRPPGASLWRAVLAPVLAVAGAALLVIGPWTVRNYLVQREFVLVSTNGGINFWIGNNPRATGEFIWPPEAAPELLQASAHLAEPARDRFFYAQGLAFIRDHPGQFVRLLGVKLFYFVWVRPEIGSFYGDQAAAGLGRLAYVVANALLLPLWLLGLALTRRDWRRMLVVYGPILAVLAQNLLYFVGTRFRTPAAPFQILLGAYTLAAAAPLVWGWLRRRPPAAAAAPKT